MNLKIKILPINFFFSCNEQRTRRFNYFKGNERVYLARAYVIGKTHARDRRSGISHRWYADKKKNRVNHFLRFLNPRARGAVRGRRKGRGERYNFISLSSGFAAATISHFPPWLLHAACKFVMTIFINPRPIQIQWKSRSSYFFPYFSTVISCILIICLSIH